MWPGPMLSSVSKVLHVGPGASVEALGSTLEAGLTGESWSV